MELLQLKYFCDAAETENFSKTAKKFFVPASNISQSIKRLEAELKTPLFSRNANRVRLNSSGQAFYKSVKAALDLLNDAQKAAQQTTNQERIRVNLHMHRRLVTDVMERFRNTHPGVVFITTHEPIRNVADYDVVLSYENFDSVLEKKEVARENFALAYNKTQFAFADKLDAQTIKRCPMIVMDNNSSIYKTTLRVCQSFGVQPNIVLQSDDPYYVRKCIELGLGVAVVPELSWRGQFSENVALKAVEGFSRQTYLYHKSGRNRVITEFVDALLQAFPSSVGESR